MHDLATFWRESPIFIAVFAVGIGTRYWRFIKQWLDGVRGRDWPQICATVDVVSVAPYVEEDDVGERITGYLGTISYFYRTPDLQMGEHTRLFSQETDAEAWTASYKNKTVIIHVDPRDASRSVLRDRDLQT